MDEMSIVEQLSKELKQNVELKASLAKCEEELVIQRALNDEELSMVDELASMEEERNRLRVEVAKLRDAAAPLQETITDLEQDKIELTQLLGNPQIAPFAASMTSSAIAVPASACLSSSSLISSYLSYTKLKVVYSSNEIRKT